MGHPLIRNWGVAVLQGAIALLFGLLFLFLPVATLVTVTFLFAAFAIVDGILAMAAVFTPEPHASRWVLALYGLAGIGIGILAFLWPGFTVVTILYLIAAWAIIIGIARIASAVALRKEIRGEWLQMLTGIVSVAFGAYVLFFPTGLATLVAVIGVYALIKGVLLIASGLRLRREAEARRRGAGPGEAGEGRTAV